MHYIIAAGILFVLVAWVALASAGLSGLRRGLTAGRVAGGVLALLAVAGISYAYVRMPRMDGPGARFDTAGAYVLPPPTERPAYVPFPVADPAQSAPAAVPPGPVRVRVKVAANLRREPSQSAKVVRAARSGDVLIRFSESNGWLQVGATRPEGWMSSAVLAPAG